MQSAGSERTPVYLKDYKAPAYFIPEVELSFDLKPDRTLVRARLQIHLNPDTESKAPLVLNGRDLELLSLSINNVPLADNAYKVKDDELRILQPPDAPFELQSSVAIAPDKNTALEGLYTSNGMFCTQCEPEGFRRITYFVDRPDVMSRYRVHITADKAKFPVLLSNGNRIATEQLDDGRHRVSYEDPYAKPAYLFALVAGQLAKLSDSFTTMDGREIQLELYTDPGNESQCHFAMQSLKEAMQWDEEVFGLSYDLETYMIVAVEDFNMGAMENKGLNIFNAKLVLANPQTATDETFEFIQAVVGHEYFHNWTGNRITCRDWFQLTLKEGLTVYRDQRFTADMTSRAVKRIKDVMHLRNFQFPEDAGPLAHPIQPDHYLEMNNFYTMTVYEKGAEVIRMIATLIGEDAFARGITRYFELYDGQAVTIHEFLHAMQDASGFDFSRFKRWYTQAGTPQVNVEIRFDAEQGILHLDLSQHNERAKSSSGTAAPLQIPLQMGLLDQDGQPLPVVPETNGDIQVGVDLIQNNDKECLLILNKQHQRFSFQNLKRTPVLSILRNFSAPIKLKLDDGIPEQAVRLKHDPDSFNRWEAGQQLMRTVLRKLIAGASELEVPRALEEAFATIINRKEDLLFNALSLNLPEVGELLGEQQPMQIEASIQAHADLHLHLARKQHLLFLKRYQELSESASRQDRQGIAARKLRNQCLWYLSVLPDGYRLCWQQFEQAENMTDELAAFLLLTRHTNEFRNDAIALFEKRWSANSLVMDHFFSAQALSETPETLDKIIQLQEHATFRWTNPNKVRALLGALARNHAQFHRQDGAGYRLLAEAIGKLDPINPGTAARLARAFVRLPRLDKARQKLAREALAQLQTSSKLSNDVFEILKAIPE